VQVKSRTYLTHLGSGNIVQLSPVMASRDDKGFKFRKFDGKNRSA